MDGAVGGGESSEDRIDLELTPNILLIPSTSSIGHLRENLAVAEFDLPQDVLAALDRIGTKGSSA
ncbi:MAG TPA: hypothetical protein VNT30_11205 [Stellaceae bacterium]|nr:hypothetical protein [Stellaceae bacterium]